MEIPQGNTMENSGKQNPKMGFKPPRAEMPTFKWLFLKNLRSTTGMPFPASLSRLSRQCPNGPSDEGQAVSASTAFDPLVERSRICR